MLSHASETFSPFYVSWSAFKGQQKHHLMAKGGGGCGCGGKVPLRLGFRGGGDFYDRDFHDPIR